ncbi:hypothetical protein K491DRAFT_327351 [Lophiostoma macrostomum CBS 122681]|uniref:F-box domain-containing protein n=1 Tax=Lophiostoma macrostomum CBS 122681 TaxID=1314788 RepID=A0A6A6TFQ2_9PLEO|nr:hypothetical protein K491DRAFT_327351 [Lophiostoma macrostomum CBS 122681]
MICVVMDSDIDDAPDYESTASDQPSRLLQLPTELRLQIYNYLREVIFRPVCGPVLCWIPYPSRAYSSLMRVSKGINKELTAEKAVDMFTDRPVLFCDVCMIESDRRVILDCMKVAQDWDKWQQARRPTQGIDRRAFFVASKYFQRAWRMNNEGMEASEAMSEDLTNALTTLLIRLRRHSVVEMRIKTWGWHRNPYAGSGVGSRSPVGSEFTKDLDSPDETKHKPGLAIKILRPKGTEQKAYSQAFQQRFYVPDKYRKYGLIPWEVATDAEMAFDPEELSERVPPVLVASRHLENNEQASSAEPLP